MITLLVIVVLLLLFLSGPRPTLDATLPDTTVPPRLGSSHHELRELEAWLNDREKKVPQLIDGAEATIVWAGEPAVTELCFVYVHGFSACRQETAPLADRIAARFGANLVYLRLAGHGLETGGMEAAAEAWLGSMVDGWEIASRIGRKLVFIATSTGAPLSLWLAQQLPDRGQFLALIFLAPNFKIRKRTAFMLTWPWARYWVPWVAGREQGQLETPPDLPLSKYWTNRYSIHAVIEMQKVVDWANRHCDRSIDIPLATLYMRDDPTVDAAASVAFHHSWGAGIKRLHPVEIEPDEPQHVFVGDITAPHRLDWCVETCVDFIESLQKP